MRDLLSYLHESFPGIFGCQFGTIRALSILHKVFNLKDLLQNCGREYLRNIRIKNRGLKFTHFFLNSQFDFYTFGVRLSPDKTCVDQADFVQTFQFLKADSKEFPGFWFSDGPGLGRGEKSFAILAEREST